jgi:hypothetical protein
MGKIQVKVLKLRGEIGLRLPGSSFLCDQVLAERFAAAGWVEIESTIVIKEEKQKIETKEEKFTKVPKLTKSKPKGKTK